ncbi:Superoxide dismutase [Cu-Zn] precursor [uncultured Synechococcales cyanobacterium]|uniref:Superoxide dismutase [Cu-Zn] n=1 Tax=uncultured Synechococcales cyanobacterium TaxID=1936017 RepID=A0A6J4VV01_9CYAN|nr:Superoxide dismutase [Cu-Zn] precursor [uncultured Synechococcales cyanobacterium]
MQKMFMVTLLLAGIAGCSGEDKSPQAIARLEPTRGNTASGTVTFEQGDGHLLIKADIAGLTPGRHGFHVHEFGDCSSGDGKSAGNHFNPDKAPHGGPSQAKRHVGDLGNVEADATGRAVLTIQDPVTSLSGSHSIISRSVVVHAKADDLRSQPAGKAGDRVACGVISLADKS